MYTYIINPNTIINNPNFNITKELILLLKMVVKSQYIRQVACTSCSGIPRLDLVGYLIYSAYHSCNL